MQDVDLLSTIYYKAYTAAADTAFRVESNAKVLVADLNVECQSNDAYMGNQFAIGSVLRKDDIRWFTAPCRPYDLLFKNYTAGSNCKIVLTGTVIKG